MIVSNYILAGSGRLAVDTTSREAVIAAMNEVDYEVGQRAKEMGLVQERALIEDARRKGNGQR